MILDVADNHVGVDRDGRRKFLDKVDNSGKPAICIALEKKNKELVKILLKAGADVNLK